MQIGRHQAPVEGFGSCSVKLYNSGMGRYYMICKIDTSLINKDFITQWFLTCIAQRQDVIFCKDDKLSFFSYPIMQIRYTQALHKQFAFFESCMKNDKTKQGFDAFFYIHKLHQSPYGRSFVYVVYANDIDFCYEKFLNIFDQDALFEFKKITYR